MLAVKYLKEADIDPLREARVMLKTPWRAAVH